MKTKALLQVNIKRFVRDKRAVFLLIVLPLLLISSIFFSFSPQGLTTIPFGIVSSFNQDTISEYQNSYFDYLRLTKYYSVNDCLIAVKNYEEYGCIDMHNPGSVKYTIYYDNTKDPVIWEVLERIKSTFQYLRVAQSKELTKDLLNKLSFVLDQTTLFSRSISEAKDKVKFYDGKILSAQKQLRSAQWDLQATISDMDEDIQDMKEQRNEIDNTRDEFYSLTYDVISEARTTINSLYSEGLEPYIADANDQLDEIEDTISDYNNELLSMLYDFDIKIANYEAKSNKGKEYVNKLSDEYIRLGDIRDDISSYDDELNNRYDELKTIEGLFESIISVSPDRIAQPFSLETIPVYIPDIELPDNKENQADKVSKGMNLLSLQTLYPTILLLILVFLSLLVSSFMTLRYINAKANQRLKLIKGMLLPEIASLFLSSVTVLIAPLIILLIIGAVLFRLPIIPHLGSVMLTLLLLVSIFVIIGMLIAYIILNESTALVVDSFLLVFFVFISGFLLPIERMSSFMMPIAQVSPGKIALLGFNQAVFYNHDFTSNTIMLVSWLIILLPLVFMVRAYRYNTIN